MKFVKARVRKKNHSAIVDVDPHDKPQKIDWMQFVKNEKEFIKFVDSSLAFDSYERSIFFENLDNSANVDAINEFFNQAGEV